MLFLAIHRGRPKFSPDQTSSFHHGHTAKIILEYSTGAPNDGFLLNTLKLLFRLSRVLSDVETDAF